MALSPLELGGRKETTDRVLPGDADTLVGAPGGKPLYRIEFSTDETETSPSAS